MHSASGALAEDSIAIEYKASINVNAMWIAIRKRHHMVWCSGLLSLIVLVVTPLASETVFIGFVGEGRCTATSGRQACTPQLSVYPVAARILQGILAFMVVLASALAIASSRRRTGVYANPSSIAGIATLFQDQRLIEDFRWLNPYAPSPKDIRLALQGNKYCVGTYNEVVNDSSYGISVIRNNSEPRQSRGTSSHRGKKYTSIAVNADKEHPSAKLKKTSSNPWLHPATVVVFALFVVGLATLVLYYNRMGGDTGFERFMDGNTFGVSFLFMAFGVVLKMYWNLIDDGTWSLFFALLQPYEYSHSEPEICAMEPYRQLLRANAKANDSILLAPNSNPFTGFFHSLSLGHFFNAYISLVAILCEPLIVALANIPFNPGTAYKTYVGATWVTVSVLLLMLIGIAWLLCRNKMPGMMRRPDTIAAVMLSLCGSHMLEDFAGMATMGRGERDRIVERRGRRYAMGCLLGVDGVKREGVDEDMFVG